MSGSLAVGVDLGGTKMLAGVVDDDCNVLHRRSESSSGKSEEALLDLAVDLITDALRRHPEAAAVGLGIPCTIDRRRGVAIAAVNLPLIDVPIVEILSDRLGVPVWIDNDANTAALAEHRFGAAQGTQNAVMITVGTGIGGGLIINGELYRGTIGAGAELGHVVIDYDGPPCQGNCPGRGCVETLASGTALGREGTEAARRAPDSALGRAQAEGQAITGATVTEAAVAGDEVARDVVALVGRRLGAALTSYANIFEPDVIAVGGGVTAGAGDLLLDPAREVVRERGLVPMRHTPIRLAQMGPDAGMIGAATMAREELARS
jgi:glucokinase